MGKSAIGEIVTIVEKLEKYVFGDFVLYCSF